MSTCLAARKQAHTEPKIGELHNGRVHLGYYRYRHEAQIAINIHGSGRIDIRPRKLRPFWANACAEASSSFRTHVKIQHN